MKTWSYKRICNHIINKTDSQQTSVQYCGIQVYDVFILNTITCVTSFLRNTIYKKKRNVCGLELEMSQLTDITKTVKYCRLKSISFSCPFYFVNMSSTEVQTTSSLLSKVSLFEHKYQLNEVRNTSNLFHNLKPKLFSAKTTEDLLIMVINKTIMMTMTIIINKHTPLF